MTRLRDHATLCWWILDWSKILGELKNEAETIYFLMGDIRPTPYDQCLKNEMKKGLNINSVQYVDYIIHELLIQWIGAPASGQENTRFNHLPKCCVLPRTLWSSHKEDLQREGKKQHAFNVWRSSAFSSKHQSLGISTALPEQLIIKWTEKNTCNQFSSLSCGEQNPPGRIDTWLYSILFHCCCDVNIM